MHTQQSQSRGNFSRFTATARRIFRAMKGPIILILAAVGIPAAITTGCFFLLTFDSQHGASSHPPRWHSTSQDGSFWDPRNVRICIRLNPHFARARNLRMARLRLLFVGDSPNFGGRLGRVPSREAAATIKIE